MTDLPRLTDQLLHVARRAGADAADAVVAETKAIDLAVQGGRLEKAERAEGIEIGLRVFLGHRQAIVSASDAAPATLERMAERVVAMAREAPEDPFSGLADPDQLAAGWDAEALDLMDPAPVPLPAELQEMALRAEAAALDVRGVSQVSEAGAGYHETRFHAAMTNGFSGGYGRTQTSIGCVAIAGRGTGMERDYYGDGRVHRADLDAPEDVGRIAGERTIANLGASKPPTGAWPVVYDERVAGQLIGHLLGAVNGRAVARGATFLHDALGEPVLPAGLALLDDPTLPRLMRSQPFDDEGLPVEPWKIVSDGVLQGWILDLRTARKLGMTSTGNAGRSAASSPSPAPSNVLLTSGTRTRADLLAEMGTGLLVTSMIGSSISATTGDYSRGASGFWVENGEIVRPVNECTIAGNLRPMLRSIIPANDARRHVSRQVPSLLVEGLTIAGA
ncbi:metallopeptidase TldD-related protein [uncultured Jannaschia sp.]|uniref:TldD/PmbA family protein n=1 Tax=uncultured Jannaschia sp. TaxID=293347 RepID=UPI0026211A67|nr:metallopeptidase TldD-related protein [uncultured Jannaschia sp.]